MTNYCWCESYDPATDTMRLVAYRGDKSKLPKHVRTIEVDTEIGRHLSIKHSAEIDKWLNAAHPAIAPTYEVELRDFDKDENLLFGADRIIGAPIRGPVLPPR